VSIGPTEIIIVLILALLVFGPKRLPQMGRSLGRGVREFRKAAETAKTELGLGEVTDSINEVKSTFTEPIKEVTGTFTDLKDSVDVKSAIEAPVEKAAAASAATAAAATAAGEASPAAVAPPQPAGDDEGPETPAVTPATAFADVTPPPAPAAPEAPEGPEDAVTAVTAAEAGADAPSEG